LSADYYFGECDREIWVNTTSMDVSAAVDSVPCVNSFGTFVDCSLYYEGIEINQEFISGMEEGTGGFDGLLGVFAGGSAVVGTGAALSPIAVQGLRAAIPILRRLGTVGVL
jgi:hypothetical protein